MFAGIIFRKTPFFHGHDVYDQLIKIVRVLGTVSFYEYLKVHYNAKSWSKMITSETKLANEDAIDLLSKILVYDQNARLLPSEALEHPYFAPVREMWRKVKTTTQVPDGSDTLAILIANKIAN